MVRAVSLALDQVVLTVEETRPPELARAYELLRILGQSGGRESLARLLGLAGTRMPSPFVQRLLDDAGRPLSAAELSLRLEEAHALRATALDFWRAYDAIICPVAAAAAAAHGTAFADDPRFSYTMSYSLLGWPAVVVRAGTSPEGLPLGVQILARPWREDIALAIAQHVEAVLGGWQAPPYLN
jgi:amidase